MIMSDEFKKMWEVAILEELSKTTNNFIQDNLSLGQDLYRAPPERESEALPLSKPVCSIISIPK
jgi:hypothetical protein